MFTQKAAGHVRMACEAVTDALMDISLTIILTVLLGAVLAFRRMRRTWQALKGWRKR